MGAIFLIMEDYSSYIPMQKALLEVLVCFHRFCEDSRLRYYAFAGTALGAVRHKGFIPWDDDLDVAMPRPDYERFLVLAEQELPDHLKLCDWRAKGAATDFSMIFDSRKEVKKYLEETYGIKIKGEHGVWIDVFPIDGVPFNKISHAIWYGKRILYKVAAMSCTEIKASPNRWIKYIMRMIMKLRFPCFSKIEFKEREHKIATSIVFDNSKMAGYVYSELKSRGWRVPMEAWGTPQLVEFEGQLMYIGEHVEQYLGLVYGDYMQFPPVEERKPKHILEVV